MESKKINRELKYKVKLTFDQSSSLNDVLTYYYTPVIGVEAVSLYNLFLAEANNYYINNVFISQERIVAMLNLSEEKINDAIAKLELVGLLTVYMNPATKDRITFVLNEPMLPTQFEKADKLTSILESVVGTDNYKINKRYFHGNKFSKTDSDISLTKEFEAYSANTRNIKDINVSYNFDLVYKLMNSANINYEDFWSREFEKAVESSIVVYDLSPLQIVEVIKDIITDSNQVTPESYYQKCESHYKVDKDAINKLISGSEISTETKLKLLEDTTPAEYIELSCERRPNKVELNAIETLSKEHSFTNQMINMLIDYSLQVNNGKLNIAYIMKIAQTANKNSINTASELRDYLKSAFKSKEESKEKIDVTKTDEFEGVKF